MSWLRNLARTFIGFAYRGINRVASVVLTRTGLGRHLVTYMARTGAGTDACYRAGCLPMPVHFYSPVPDLDDLDKRRVWARRSELPGIDWQPDAQAARLRELGTGYGAECDWPLRGDPDGAAFFVDNGRFSFGCAAATHCLLRALKPRRVIEIGSGMSTRVIGGGPASEQGRGSPGRVHCHRPAPGPRHAPRTGDHHVHTSSGWNCSPGNRVRGIGGERCVVHRLGPYGPDRRRCVNFLVLPGRGAAAAAGRGRPQPRHFAPYEYPEALPPGTPRSGCSGPKPTCSRRSCVTIASSKCCSQ